MPKLKNDLPKGYFPFDFNDVFGLLGIQESVPKGKSKDIKCPICNGKGKKCNVKNTAYMPGYNCWHCGGGGILKFYAACKGYSSLSGVYKEIMQELEVIGSSRKDFDYKKVIETAIEEEPILPVEYRDYCYEKMLHFMSLSKKHKESLMERGLPENFIRARGYRSTLTNDEDCKALARKMINSGINLKGLPGFFMDKGEWTFMWNKSGILIPDRDIHGRIQGFQIRYDNSELVPYQRKNKDGSVEMVKPAKYITLSTSNKKYGGRMPADCHFAADFVYDLRLEQMMPVFKSRTLWVTEGPLKADITHELTGQPLVAVLGVNNVDALERALKDIINSGVDIDTIYDCMDMDYLNNKNVKRAVEKLKKMVEALGLKYVRKTWNPEYKGIDDFALAYKKGEYKK